MISPRRPLWQGVLAASIAASLAACSGDDDDGPAPVEECKAAWVYIGPVGDRGWSYQHNEGRLDVEAANLPNVNAKTFNENTSEEQLGSVIQRFMDDGVKIVFSTSLDWRPELKAAADANPGRYFEQCAGGTPSSTNYSNYNVRDYQAAYLGGLVAGAYAAERGHKVGITSSVPIEAVVHSLVAFGLGVRAADPVAEIHLQWTCNFLLPQRERCAVAKQIDEKGVDVIYMNSDVTDSIDVAREKGIKAISYHSDVLSFFPDTILTGVTFTWGDYYRQRVQAACDGSWASGNYFGGFKERNVALGRYGQGVPEGIKAVVTERQRQMEAGEWDVFTGPIRAQDGTLLVPNGKRLSDAELRTFTTLTEGFVGTVPNLADCDGGASDAAAVCREIQQ